MHTVVVGTAGHIDHGKSALVRALTGTDPDRLKEEQLRGITIDLGFAHFTVGDAQIALVDVPGHERFVRNMLAGVGGIDAVMLVVAANESIKPQTREHFDICRLIGIEHGIVALTKTDLVDPNTLDGTIAEIRELTAGSFLQDAPIVPVSAHTGAGIDALARALAGLAGRSPRQHRAGVVRQPIDRVFTIKGFGAVVTGTLVSGAIAVGDTLTVLPEGREIRVRGIQVHGAAATSVAAPQRAAVNVAGVEASSLHRGMTIATPGALTVTSRADVRIELLPSARPLRHGARVRVHHGTTEIFARISVAATRTRRSAPWQPAEVGDALVEVPAGGDVLARLRLEQPGVLTRGDRFVIRSASPVVTVGGGVVLDPEPGTAGVRRHTAAARFAQLDVEDVDRVVTLFLAEAGLKGLRPEDLVRRAGVGPSQAEKLIGRFVSAGSAQMVGDRVFAAAAMQELSSLVETELARFHKVHPRETGMPRETLRGRLARGTDAGLFDATVAGLVARGVAHGSDRVALMSHQPLVESGELRLRQAVEDRLRSAALMPPDTATLAPLLHASPAAIDQAVQALVRDGRLVRMGDMVFHRDPLVVLKREVAGLRSGQPAGARVTLDVGAFKTRHGLTRKHAIPLLEWLDRERVTRRVGDVRIVI